MPRGLSGLLRGLSLLRGCRMLLRGLSKATKGLSLLRGLLCPGACRMLLGPVEGC